MSETMHRSVRIPVVLVLGLFALALVCGAACAPEKEFDYWQHVESMKDEEDEDEHGDEDEHEEDDGDHDGGVGDGGTHDTDQSDGGE